MATIISKKRVRKPSGTITTKKVTGELQGLLENMAGFAAGAIINKGIEKAADTVFPSSEAPVSGINVSKMKDPFIHGTGMLTGILLQLSVKSPAISNIAKGYSLYNAASMVKDFTGKSYLNGTRLLSGVSPNARELAQVYPESMIDMLPPVEDTSLVSV